MFDWTDWAVVAGFVVFFAGMGTCGYYAYLGDEERAAAFMAECQKDRKHYECVALYRAGESHTTVVPMPVVIGR